jgi:hypothetical protein
MQVLRNRPKKSGKKKYNFVKGSTSATPRKRKATSKSVKKAPARNSVKKTRTPESRASPGSQVKKRVKKQAKKRTRRAPVAIDTPGWSDLKTTKNGRTGSKAVERRLLSTLSTVKISLLILATAAVISLYVGHVQATQELLNDVYLARKDNLALSTLLEKKQGDFDTRIGPAVIYPLAYDLGLRESLGIEQPVVVGANLN